MDAARSCAGQRRDRCQQPDQPDRDRPGRGPVCGHQVGLGHGQEQPGMDWGPASPGQHPQGTVERRRISHQAKQYHSCGGQYTRSGH